MEGKNGGNKVGAFGQGWQKIMEPPTMQHFFFWAVQRSNGRAFHMSGRQALKAEVNKYCVYKNMYAACAHGERGDGGEKRGESHEKKLGVNLHNGKEGGRDQFSLWVHLFFPACLHQHQLFQSFFGCALVRAM